MMLGRFPIHAWSYLGPILGLSWGLLGPSWGHLGAILGQSWSLLGLLGAVWGPIGAKRGQIGPTGGIVICVTNYFYYLLQPQLQQGVRVKTTDFLNSFRAREMSAKKSTTP